MDLVKTQITIGGKSYYSLLDVNLFKFLNPRKKVILKVYTDKIFKTSHLP